ncbi:hypothetical protein ACIO1C_14475 [Streptomyces sp. NPDC087420]|uniref:hypothetical protein n=1 Tax=Streptomyces sp. NPDC087420 TaxID=3365785 RepID=UPI0038394353
MSAPEEVVAAWAESTVRPSTTTKYCSLAAGLSPGSSRHPTGRLHPGDDCNSA